MLRAAAIALAANRVLFGIAYLAAPRRTASGWIGQAGSADATTVVTRALGARDLMLGAGALTSLFEGDAAQSRRWFAAQAVADGADLAATIAVRRRLPPSGFRFGTGMAAASTAIASAAAARLEP